MKNTSMLSSAAFSVLVSIIIYCYTYDNVNEKRSEEVKQTKTEAEILSYLHYNLHLINPEKGLKEKVSFGLKILSEILKEPVFSCFACINKDLEFIAASKINSSNQQQSILDEDPLIKEISTKIKNLTDYDSLINSGGSSKAIEFVNENQVKGLIFTIELYSKVYGILVEMGKDKLSQMETRIIKEFCKGLSLVIENHQRFNKPQNTETKTNKKKESEQILYNLYDYMFPASIPTIPGWEIAKYFYPSANRADFMDILNINTDKYMILFGKCSGYGINAAIYINKLKLIIRCFIDNFQSPAKLLNKISNYLNSELMPDLFVDVTAITFSPIDNQITVTMAGNTLPIINRTRSGFAEIPELETGIPLGLFNQGTEPYKDQLINIMPGDGILLHTDGITDHPGKGHERVSNEDLKNILDKLPEQGAEDMLNNLIKEIKGNNSNELPEEDHSIIYLKAE